MRRTPTPSFPSRRVLASVATMEADDRLGAAKCTHYTIAARLLRSRAKRALASLRSKPTRMASGEGARSKPGLTPGFCVRPLRASHKTLCSLDERRF